MTVPLASVASDTAATLREQVYESLREALTQGKFAPGQKLTIRSIGNALGVSVMPVREALRRLTAEGAFEMQPNRSVRVPLMTRAKIVELRDIRVALEGLAAERAAEHVTPEKIAELQQLALEIVAARERGDSAIDRIKIREFHFTLYRTSGQTTLVRMIEALWLQTGPYMNLLFPAYVRGRRGEGRRRLIQALQAREGASARREIADDIREALTYVADLADDEGVIGVKAAR
ncbi:MAG: GntR family transcriptional regulator [Alphaproteobacteria bacterium]|nr:GntR family transcriptional regulator [Alphaproteobacteria bacterium]